MLVNRGAASALFCFIKNSLYVLRHVWAASSPYGVCVMCQEFMISKSWMLVFGAMT
jgi:hypothetical protein